MEVLQRVRAVKAPARRTPRGRHVDHCNESLVQNVRVELVLVAVEVGDGKIRGCAKLGRGSEGHTEE